LEPRRYSYTGTAPSLPSFQFVTTSYGQSMMPPKS
jgi:hypothetical protein